MFYHKKIKFKRQQYSSVCWNKSFQFPINFTAVLLGFLSFASSDLSRFCRSCSEEKWLGNSSSQDEKSVIAWNISQECACHAINVFKLKAKYLILLPFSKPSYFLLILFLLLIHNCLLLEN